MQLDIWYLSAYSILPATLLGMVRYKNSDKSYHPFLWLLFVGFIAECLNIILAHSIHNNLIVHRYMILMEFGITMYQFKVWGLFYKKRQLYWSFLALILISWLVESIINNNIFDLHFIGVNIYTKSLSAFLIGILSIHQLNKVVLTEKAALFTNSKFLICCGFLISFIYLMFQSIFQLYESTSNEFLNKIIVPFAYSNIFVNVFLFLGAVYFIPKKKRNLWLL